jgi:LysR family nitrogen assimilation transcriptional regulator
MSYLLKEMVLQGRLDMTVTYQFEPSPGIVEQPLFNEMLYLVSPVQSGIKPCEKGLSIDEVAQYPLFLSSSQTGMRRIVQAALAAHGITVEPLAEVDSLRTLLVAVETGNAHTILPASALQKHLTTQPDRSLVINSLNISRNVVLCTSEHLPLGATATAVYDLLDNLIHKALEDGRWVGIRPISDAPST